MEKKNIIFINLWQKKIFINYRKFNLIIFGIFLIETFKYIKINAENQ